MNRATNMVQLLLLAIAAKAQETTIAVGYYYPKDSVRFGLQHRELPFGYRQSKYGKTTMIACCQSEAGCYYMIFKKQIRHLSRMIEYNNGAVGEVYDFTSRKWLHEEGTWSHAEMQGAPTDTTTYSIHNLYCLIVQATSTGMVEKGRFQDFGNEVYWPEFDYPSCSISDEDRDGIPEFYLSNMCNSDGLDAKPYKQLVYTLTDKSGTISKAKATAFYPAGNEEDTYHVEYDTSWQKMSVPVQRKSRRIIDNHKKANRE